LHVNFDVKVFEFRVTFPWLRQIWFLFDLLLLGSSRPNALAPGAVQIIVVLLGHCPLGSLSESVHLLLELILCLSRWLHLWHWCPLLLLLLLLLLILVVGGVRLRYLRLRRLLLWLLLVLLLLLRLYLLLWLL